MTVSTLGFALMTMASISACLGQDLANPADPPPLGPLRIVAEEPGVGRWYELRVVDSGVWKLLGRLKGRRGDSHQNKDRECISW